MKKLLVVTLLAGVFVSACGGGSASAETPVSEDLTQTELEVKFNLPQEPTLEMEGYDTILGVDSNDNNIRDDVERDLTFKFYKYSEDLNTLLSMAKDHHVLTEKSINIENGKDTKEGFTELYNSYLLEVFCYVGEGGLVSAANLEYLDNKILNTDDRYLNNYILSDYASSSLTPEDRVCK